MSTKQTFYFPTRVFDDKLAAFASMYTAKGWSFTGVDGNQLAVDAANQRDERAEMDAVELTYVNTKAQFAQNQHDRFKRFGEALNAARGIFRNDPVISAELAKFKLPRNPRSTPVEEPPTTTPANV